MNSLRSKVFLGVLAGVLLVILVAELVVYRQAVSFAENELYGKLRKFAVALSQVVHIDDSDKFNLQHDWESKLKLGIEDQTQFFEFLTMDNEFLTDSHNLGGENLPEIGEHNGSQLVDYGNIILGVYQFHFSIFDEDQSKRDFKLIVAENTDHINSARRETLKQLALGTPLALLAAFVASLGLTTLTLSSLGRFRDRVMSYQRGDDKSELSLTNVDKEMLPLGRAINQFIRQINQHAILESKLLADTAHELRTPLVNMRKEVDQLQIEKLTGNELTEVADRLDSELTVLQRMTDNMLLLYRIESGNYQPRLELFDIKRELKNNILSSLNTSYNDKIELSGDSVRVYSNRSVLQVIVSQLLSNADTYAADSEIQVSWESKDESIHLYVDDAGPGIPESDSETIFSRNYRFEHLDTTAPSGSGLGLTLVRLYAESVNARVTCATSPLGGARFTVVLPSSESALETDSKTDSETDDAQSKVQRQ